MLTVPLLHVVTAKLIPPLTVSRPVCVVEPVTTKVDDRVALVPENAPLVVMAPHATVPNVATFLLASHVTTLLAVTVPKVTPAK